MIDLEELLRSADKADGTDAVVSRSWLKQVHAELSECRAAQARGRCFGLKPGQAL